MTDEVAESKIELHLFTDVIHGPILVHPLLLTIIETPQFQRLRNIKQTGLAFYVFPSATHSRFEHCIGTSCLAGKMMDFLGQKYENLSPEDMGKWKLCVQIAALCHDVGHGPFSHTWEYFRQRIIPFDKWTHEAESVRILDEILETELIDHNQQLYKVRDKCDYYGLKTEHIQAIKDMIVGVTDPRPYWYQIVNNKMNGIDVDKWDYLARDSYMLNIPIAFDYKRLLHSCRVFKNAQDHEEICFKEGECESLIELFLMRSKLHVRAYQHIKVLIIQEMVIDAFIICNERLNLTETPITKLSDHIFYKILHDDFGNDDIMLKAKKLLIRVQRRDLYKVIAGKLPRVRKYVSPKYIENVLAKKYPNFSEDFAVIEKGVKDFDKSLKSVKIYSENAEEPTVVNFNWKEYLDEFYQANPSSMRKNEIYLLHKGGRIEEDCLKKVKDDFFKMIDELSLDLRNSSSQT